MPGSSSTDTHTPNTNLPAKGSRELQGIKNIYISFVSSLQETFPDPQLIIKVRSQRDSDEDSRVITAEKGSEIREYKSQKILQKEVMKPHLEIGISQFLC